MFFLILPLGTTRKQRQWPYVTWAIVALNVLLYAYSLGLGEDGFNNLLQSYGFVPAHPSVLTVLSSQFLHAGFVHLAGNMVFLITFGPCVEDALGPPLYLIFYLVGGIAAVFLHSMLAGLSGVDRAVPMVGASGALAALMGLSALRFHRYHVRIWYFLLLFLMFIPRVFSGTFKLQCAIATGAWGAMETVPAVASLFIKAAPSQVAHWAHLGGFGLGLLVSLAFGLAKEGTQEYTLEEGERAPLTNFPEIARLVEREPDNAAGWVLFARARWKTGHAQECCEAYLNALRLYAERKQVAESAQVYRELFRRFQGTVLPGELLVSLGAMFDEAGQPELALHAYTCRARLDPQGPEGAIAMMKAGRLCLEQSDYARASAWFRAFLRQHPQSEWAGMVQGMLQKAEREAGPAPGQAPVRRGVPPPPPPPPPASGSDHVL